MTIAIVLVVWVVVACLIALGFGQLMKQIDHADVRQLEDERARRRFLAMHNCTVQRIETSGQLQFRCDYVTAWNTGSAYGATSIIAIDRARLAVLTVRAEDLRGVLTPAARREALS